jgi:hypothetical protein
VTTTNVIPVVNCPPARLPGDFVEVRYVYVPAAQPEVISLGWLPLALGMGFIGFVAARRGHKPAPEFDGEVRLTAAQWADRQENLAYYTSAQSVVDELPPSSWMARDRLNQ